MKQYFVKCVGLFKHLFTKKKQSQSIMNQKSYTAYEIPIDEVPLPYGQSLLSMTRYNIK